LLIRRQRQMCIRDRFQPNAREGDGRIGSHCVSWNILSDKQK
jgi:hypothetical protein